MKDDIQIVTVHKICTFNQQGQKNSPLVF